MDEDADILDQRSSLREYLRVLRRRKWIVITTALAIVGITLAYSLNQPTEYAATAYVQVPPPGGPNPLEDLDPTNLTVDQQRTMMQNESALARSDDVRREVRKQLGSRPRFAVEPVVSSSILAITGLSSDSRNAARTANTVARAYLDQSLEQRRDTLREAIESGEAAIESLQDQVRELPSSSPGREDVYLAAANLRRQVANASARLQLMTDSGGSIRFGAVAPEEPESPKTARNVSIAAVLGLLLGVALAFLVDRLDDRIRTKRDVDIASRSLPNLGVVPWSTAWSDGKAAELTAIAQPDSTTTDGFRTVRTSIEILGLSEPIRTIAVTSAEPAEGKSATVANLAVVLARANHSVAVVCCDFRRPRLHEFFGVSNDVGFTSVLVGEVTLDQALKSIVEVPGLSLLTSGPIAPNPSELLSLGSANEMLQELARHFDYVLVDCPPVLPVPDPLVVARLVDGMIVVAMAKRTTKRRLERALELLDQAHAPVLGTVFTGITAADGYGYESRGAYALGTKERGGLRRTIRRRRDPQPTVSAPTSATSTSATSTAGTRVVTTNGEGDHAHAAHRADTQQDDPSA